MNATRIGTLIFALATLPFAAYADPDKDESGHGKRRHGKSEYKQEYWDGNCKVEIKQKKGEYKEERKCKDGHAGYAQPVYQQAPVYLPAPVYVEPGVTINGTVRVR